MKDKFKGNAQIILNVITELAIIFFAATILIYGGIQGVKLGMNEISPTLYIKVGYIYTVLPISGVFVTQLAEKSARKKLSILQSRHFRHCL